MSDTKNKVLIVEDDIDVADMLNAYFRVQGYDVYTVNWGEDAITACKSTRPDLIILDIRLPDIDGYEVARRLRSQRRTETIPIIFLTERSEREDRVRGLQLGADDYITKPFDIQELRLRVRNSLQRSSMGGLNNPVTNLPEGILVDEHLSAQLERNSAVAFFSVSLQHLTAFRESYGFVASDDVLRAVSVMIQNAIREAGTQSDFIGHLSSTKFIISTMASNPAKLYEGIKTRLQQSLEYFYPLKDRQTTTDEKNRLNIHMKQVQFKNGHGLQHVKSLKENL